MKHLAPLAIACTALLLTGCTDHPASASQYLQSYIGTPGNADALREALKTQKGRDAIARAAAANPLVAFDGVNRVVLIEQTNEGDALHLVELSATNHDAMPKSLSLSTMRLRPGPPESKNTISDLRFADSELHYTVTTPGGETDQLRIVWDEKTLRLENIP